MTKTKVLIIGAGPSGISAAVQLKREGIHLVLIEKNVVGGLIVNANKIENYPGFPKGISGVKFAQLLNKHLVQWNIKPVKDKVINCEFVKDKSTGEESFVISCENGQFKSEYLIIATGTKPVKPKDIVIPKDCKEFIFNEIFRILKVKNKNITIIGGGDAAFDYALNLSKENKISICNRSDKIKALDLLVNRAMKEDNIKYYPQCVLRKIVKARRGLELNFKLKNRKFVIETDILIFAIGREADIDYLGGSVKNRIGKLISQKRLFLIGDVNNEKNRQLSISCGDGVRVAMEIAFEIKSQI
jgi:thioredoxin reductase